MAFLVTASPPAHAQIYTRLNRNGVMEATNIPDAPDFRLTYPGKGTLIHSRGFRLGYFGEFDPHIADAAAIHGVSTELIQAVIQVESEYDRLAVSSKGALGLMQLMPATARRYGVSDAFDARQNIFGGVSYLRFLLDLFQGDITLVLAGYNAGENAVLRYKGVPPYKETRGYVQKIQAILSGTRLLAQAPRFFAAKAAEWRTATKPARAAKIVPAKPQVYYRWRDDRGLLHIAHTPPSEGVVYSMIRATE